MEIEASRGQTPDSLEPAPTPAVPSEGNGSVSAPSRPTPHREAPLRPVPQTASPLALPSTPPGVAGPPASGTSTIPAWDAAALFAQANAVRRSGDHAGAAELYHILIERYPRSAETHEAEAALGRLLLDDGNARAALRHFDEYLYVGGPLEEDVTVDRALALNRLQRPRDEADTWSSLLRAHPSSVHAERARTRLRELGDR